MKIKPFSDNILFYDSEFTSLDPYKGEIVSVGLVKPNGEEFYVEIEHDPNTADIWVQENILPTLMGDFLSRKEAIKKIEEFIGDSQPFLMSYVNQYDTIYWYKLFGKKLGKNDGGEREKELVRWLPIDFASLLFFCGFNPDKFSKEQENFLNMDIKKRKQHNALEDARLLRDIYYKFLERINN